MTAILVVWVVLVILWALAVTLADRVSRMRRAGDRASRRLASASAHLRAAAAAIREHNRRR